MKRICIIDIAGLSQRLIAQQSGLWVDSIVPAAGGAMRPTLPAVAASVQASMTTGREPGQHGQTGARREGRGGQIAQYHQRGEQPQGGYGNRQQHHNRD